MLTNLRRLGFFGASLAFIYGCVFVWIIVQMGNAMFYLGKAPRASAEERRYAQYAAYEERRELALKRLESGGEKTNSYPERAADEYYAANNKTLESFIDPFSDDNAQEGMWRAAEYLVYISFFQLFVGGFSVYLIFETLRSTNSTLESAKDATEAANRTADAAERAEKAYIYPLANARFSHDKKNIVLEIRVGNFGRTPAREGKISTGFYEIDKSVNDEDGGVLENYRTDKFDVIAAGKESEPIRTETQIITSDYFVPYIGHKPHLLAIVEFIDAYGKVFDDSCVMYFRFYDNTGAAISNALLNSGNTQEIRDKATSVKVEISRKKNVNDNQE